jgi:hypothetical protein
MYTQIANPAFQQTRTVRAIVFLLLILVSFALSLWGSIWLLVIAFEESVLQFVLCFLLAPLYSFGYIVARFEKTKGAAALMFSSLLVLIAFAAVAAIDRSVRFSGPGAASVDGGATADLNSGGPATTRTANRALVEAGEKSAREYATALDVATSQLASVQPAGSLPGWRSTAIKNVAVARTAGSRMYQLKLGVNEMTVLKYRVGDKVRSSLGAFKAEMTRIEAFPGQQGMFRDSLDRVEKELDLWGMKPHDDVVPELVGGPSIPPGGMPAPAGPAPAPVPGPRPGMRDRNPFRAGQPGRRSAANLEQTSQRFLAEHGGRAVTIYLTGIPANDDPARGVTAREASEAVSQRIRELAPSATHWMRQRVNSRNALFLAPVDDVEALARSIDCGTATVNGREIHLAVSPDYVAKVPRLPAESPPPGRNPGPSASNSDPGVPAGADEVERSLAQLRSSDLLTRKQAVQRLGRTFPDHRLAEVVAALLPLLENDDNFLVIDVIKTLAVWKSPESVPALIDRASDNRVFVRHEALKALAKSKDPRAVEPIVARIKEDGFQVEDALKDMGAMAEPALIERLTNPDTDVRRRACNILKVIGGKETLKAMQALPTDPEFSVQVAAREATKAIVARVGQLAPSRSRKGATDAPSRKKTTP